MASIFRNIFALFGHPPRAEGGPVTQAIRAMRTGQGGR